MAAWQCVPKMLDIYKYIKKNIPSATLTIFTSQQKVAKELVLKKEVDVKIEYCAPEMMNAKLSEFKYGFLIRDNIKVNQIATPTKINTYMAAGIIPIFLMLLMIIDAILLSKIHLLYLKRTTKPLLTLL